MGAREHVCVDCLALPERPTSQDYEALAMRDDDPDPYYGPYRPSNPRPAPHGGPKSRRCVTHYRAWRHDKRQAAREKRSETVYGLERGDRADLMALQDGKCPICARGLDMDNRGRFRATAHDHDHDLAEQHDHPVNESCPECLRGLTCGWCNRELLPRIDLEAARRLVAYYENPPMARMRAARLRRTG